MKAPNILNFEDLREDIRELHELLQDGGEGGMSSWQIMVGERLTALFNWWKNGAPGYRKSL